MLTMSANAKAGVSLERILRQSEEKCNDRGLDRKHVVLAMNAHSVSKSKSHQAAAVVSGRCEVCDAFGHGRCEY